MMFWLQGQAESRSTVAAVQGTTGFGIGTGSVHSHRLGERCNSHYWMEWKELGVCMETVNVVPLFQCMD